MFNRIRSTRQTRTNVRKDRNAILGFDSLDPRELMTAIVYNPIGSPQPTTQLYTFKVTNPTPTTQTIDLAIHQLASGNGTLNKTSVTLAPNASTNVVFTPTSNSSYAQDTYITRTFSGSSFPFQTDYYSIVNVTMPSDIRNMDTPTGMPNRIPPRVDTTVTVGVSPSLTGSEPLVLTVKGQGNGHGTVSLDGYSYLQITDTTTVNLKGINQTMISTAANNYAGFLKLAVVTSPTNQTPVIQSLNGFSVSAIPVAVKDVYFQAASINQPGYIGLENYVQFTSDSGNNNDLSGITVMEQIADIASSQSGVYSGVTTNGAQSYLPLSFSNGIAYMQSNDINASSYVYLRSPGGTNQVNQLYLFKDARAGFAPTPTPVANSGMTWVSTIFFDVNTGFWTLNIRKTGTATSVNGYTVNEGSVYDSGSPAGEIDRSFIV